LRTDKNNNFKFTIKFLMTLDRSYIGYLGFLGIDLFESVLMNSNGTICLIKLLFKIGLFTVYWRILKKTILFSGFENPYKKIRETRKLESIQD
jgi:hypothetical protein